MQFPWLQLCECIYTDLILQGWQGERSVFMNHFLLAVAMRLVCGVSHGRAAWEVTVSKPKIFRS